MHRFLAHTYDLLLKGGAAVAGFFSGMLGGDNRAAMLLVALMVADYISGVVAAAMGKSKKSTHGKLSSEAGARGILKKTMMLMVVMLAFLLDQFVGEGNAMFSAAAIWFYISNEGLSLLENLALCGVPVPRKISRMLEKVHEADGDDVDAVFTQEEGTSSSNVVPPVSTTKPGGSAQNG